MSSAGGEPTVLTKPNREHGEGDHLWPQFLPGSQAVLFTITPTTGGIDASQVAVLDLRTGTQKILMRGGSQAQYVPSGHLVYVAAGTLRAVAFDLKRLEMIGTAIPVVSQVVTLPNGTAEFDIARDGTLVYVRRWRWQRRPRGRSCGSIARVMKKRSRRLRPAPMSLRGCHRMAHAWRSRSAIRRTISGSGTLPARR